MAHTPSSSKVPLVGQRPRPEKEWRENLNVRLECADCRDDPPELYEDHVSGDLICANCGLVLQQRSIDASSEWRTFSDDDQGNEDPSRIGDGTNALLNGAQLETRIEVGDGGIRSKELHHAQNQATLDRANESLLEAYQQIGSLCDGWQLPSSVSDTAKHLFKEADENKYFTLKNEEALIAGCVFLACRRHQVPRSFHEAMKLTNVSKEEIRCNFNLLRASLMLTERDKWMKDASSRVAGVEDSPSLTLAEIQELLLHTRASGAMGFNEEHEPSAIADPKDLCIRYCSMLDVKNQTTNVAVALAEQIAKIGTLAGRSPLSSAAACILMASRLLGESVTAKEIQSVTHVSESTLRYTYKLLHQDKDKLITEEIVNRAADLGKLG